MKHRARANGFLRWLILPAALFAACGDGETTPPGSENGGNAGSGRDAGDGSAGTTGAAGSSATGGSAGTEGGMNNVRTPRRCGHGVPCGPGAQCSVTYIESGLDCTCDESGHFFCDAWAGAGAPPMELCPRRTGCSGSGGSAGTDDGSCSLSNGYCTKTCACPSGTCTTECSGNGPPASEGDLCDRSYCENPSRYSCEVKDGSCDYQVECRRDVTPVVTGGCD